MNETVRGIVNDASERKEATVVAVLAELRKRGLKVRRAKHTYMTCSIAFDGGERVPLDVRTAPATWRGEATTKLVVRVGDHNDRRSRVTFRAMKNGVNIVGVASAVVEAHAGRVTMAEEEARRRLAREEAKSINADLGIDDDGDIAASVDGDGGLTIEFDKAGTREQIVAILKETIACGLIQPKKRSKRR